MTRLILWRHGQTTWNAIDRIQGHTDVDLDDIGRVQATAAAARLAREHPDAIVASDLRRAVDTAAALAALTGLPVHTDARLRERNLGLWQGMSAAEVATAHPEPFARWKRGEAVDACEVESMDDLVRRVSAGVAEAVSMVDGGGTVVVVTHGGTAKCALGLLLDLPREAASRVMGLDNCHWTDLARHPIRGWLLRAHNVGVTPALGPGADQAATVGVEVSAG